MSEVLGSHTFWQSGNMKHSVPKVIFNLTKQSRYIVKSQHSITNSILHSTCDSTFSIVLYVFLTKL